MYNFVLKGFLRDISSNKTALCLKTLKNTHTVLKVDITSVVEWCAMELEYTSRCTYILERYVLYILVINSTRSPDPIAEVSNQDIYQFPKATCAFKTIPSLIKAPSFPCHKNQQIYFRPSPRK